MTVTLDHRFNCGPPSDGETQASKPNRIHSHAADCASDRSERDDTPDRASMISGRQQRLNALETGHTPCTVWPA
jgi:hypothetical protein